MTQIGWNLFVSRERLLDNHVDHARRCLKVERLTIASIAHPIKHIEELLPWKVARNLGRAQHQAYPSEQRTLLYGMVSWCT